MGQTDKRTFNDYYLHQSLQRIYYCLNPLLHTKLRTRYNLGIFSRAFMFADRLLYIMDND